MPIIVAVLGELMGSTVAKWCAIIGGICLLIAGISGLASMDAVKNFVEVTLGIKNTILHIIFIILIFIASFGGLAVIAGGFLIGGKMVRIGKFLIALGAGIGLIGLLIAFAVAYSRGAPVIWVGSGIGFFGVILSIVARILA